MAHPVGASAFVSRLVRVKAAREAPWSFVMLSPTSSQRSCRAVWASPALAVRASKRAVSAGKSLSRMRDIRPLRAAVSRADVSRPGSRSSRVLEAEEAVDQPASVPLSHQEGDVPAELRHAHAARVAPRLLEGAELRRVVRRDASRRDIQTEVHVAQGRPVAPRHCRQLGGAPNRVERRPFENRRVGVQRGIRPRVVTPVRVDETRVQRVDPSRAGCRLAGGRPRWLRTGEAYDAKGYDGYPERCAHLVCTACPPNSWRSAAITLAPKDSSWRERNRASSDNVMTGAGTSRCIASSTVQRPSPESST